MELRTQIQLLLFQPAQLLVDACLLLFKRGALLRRILADEGPDRRDINKGKTFRGWAVALRQCCGNAFLGGLNLPAAQLDFYPRGAFLEPQLFEFAQDIFLALLLHLALATVA